MTKDVIEAILERRSVRKFKKDPVPHATIGRIMDAAIHAPSAGNLQPWQFYVVMKEELRAALSSAAFNQKSVLDAPVVVVVCADPQLSGKKYNERGIDLYCLQDTAAAIQNILLAATGYGLGTCWVGAFDEGKVAGVLELPKNVRPVAMIPIGYTDGSVTAPPRRNADEVVHVLE